MKVTREGEYYVVAGLPINGHDWRFIREPGRLYVFRPDAEGNETEIPWEPGWYDDQARLDAQPLFTIAKWAYEIALEHGTD